MSKATPGVADEREHHYLKRLAFINALDGPALLKEFFGANQESILKEVASGKVDRNPGRQNKRKGTVWRVNHRTAKRSRQKNRPIAKHTLRRVQGRS